MADKLTIFGEMALKASKSLAPLDVFFELTHRCNNKCIHCGVVTDSEELPTGKILTILDEAAGLGSLFLTLTGGEPMLRPDFFDIAAHAVKRNFALRIFTNGTLIDRAAADRLADLHPMEIDISLHGACAETHDKITAVAGSFDRVCESVRFLKERELQVSVKCVLMRNNYEYYNDIFALAESLGVPCRIDPTITPRDNGDTSPLDLRLSIDQLVNIVGDMRIFGGVEPADHPGEWCRAGTVDLAISPDGIVMPCIQWRLRAGDLKTDSLTNIWRNSGVFTALRSEQSPNSEQCANCPQAVWCGKCPGIAQLEAGNWKAAYPWACSMASLLCNMKGARK